MTTETKNLHDMEVEAYLYDSVNIDDFAMDEEFKRVAADIAYWNARYSEAVKAHQVAKLEAKLEKSAAWKRAREAVELRGEKLTDKGIEAEAETDQLWVDKRMAEIDAEALSKKIGGFAEAVAAKKDMLQSLGARLRVELEGDAHVRRRQPRMSADDDLG